MREAEGRQGLAVVQLPTESILPNPAQPRRSFDRESLASLASSVASCGVIQPITVRKSGTDYVLVAGERRLRAAKLAGLRTVPCLVTELGEGEAAIVSLVENLHRRDLTFLEAADGLRLLIDLCRLSQEEAARRVGLSPSAVSNRLRLLTLPRALLEKAAAAGLTERHVRVLLPLPEDLRCEVLETAVREGLTVSGTEALAARLLRGGSGRERGRTVWVVKDVRLFLNAVRKSVDVLRGAGVEARCGREDTAEDIVLTIRIPKSGRRQ